MPIDPFEMSHSVGPLRQEWSQMQCVMEKKRQTGCRNAVKTTKFQREFQLQNSLLWYNALWIQEQESAVKRDKLVWLVMTSLFKFYCWV